MATLPDLPNGTIELRTSWQLPSSTHISSTAFAFSIGDGVEMSTFLDYQPLIVDLLHDRLPAGTDIIDTKIRYTLVSGSAFATTVPIGTPADGSGSFLPPNCSFLVNKHTLASGRTGRGACFLPPPVEAQVDALGRIDAGTVTGMQADLDTFLEGVLALPLWGPAVLLGLRPLGSSSPTSYAKSDIIDQPLGFIVNGLLSTQRRRMR